MAWQLRIAALLWVGLLPATMGTAASAAPAAAPVVVTGAATNVTPTSATLNGTVDPDGRPTTWYFEYGTSTSYGSRTPDRNAGSGTSPVSVSAGISGLTRGTLFHFRLVATSDVGTTRGADRTFTTVGLPTVVTGAATRITPSSARLEGSVTPNGQETKWFFEYGTSTSYGSKTGSRSAGDGMNAVNVSAALTRLKSATTYHYRLVGTNDSGTTLGADRTLSTSGPPLVITAAAQGVGPTTATAAGSVDPRGLATTWYFEYGTSTRYATRTPRRSAGSGTGARSVTVALSGLTAATTYHYRLVATSDAGTTRGADVAFTTVGVTMARPAPIVVFGRTVTLSGTVPSGRAGETVTVLAQAFGARSFSSLANVQTTAGGAWRYLARPRIVTAYRASWNRGESPAFNVAVRPAVSFLRTARGSFVTRVTGARSFGGRVVQLQRRTAAGTWVTIKRVRLNARSAATFRATLPTGRSSLRIAMSVNQAGAGYLAGFSRTLVFGRAS